MRIPRRTPLNLPMNPMSRPRIRKPAQKFPAKRDTADKPVMFSMPDASIAFGPIYANVPDNDDD